VARAALGRDPGNPALAGILEGIEMDLGNLDAALAYAKRAQEMLPRDFAMVADEASILMRLGRFGEAEGILTQAARSGADLDMLAPVLADLWTRAGRFEEGLRFLDTKVAGRPGDRRLRIIHAGLLRLSGDAAGAEREFRAILSEDPSSEDALEAIVSLLSGSGRTSDAEAESLAAAGFQPGNQANSLRAAKVCEARGDLGGSVRNLLAAELSGPVNATFELTLALQLYQLRRMDEVMGHLAQARELSTYEGDPAVTESIDRLIGRMRAESVTPPAG
jgi:tetratricopeptide (TPR) repeat protein